MDVRVFSPEETLAVGDACKIKKVLEKHGPVEIVDASGKPAVEDGKSPGAGLQGELALCVECFLDFRAKQIPQPQRIQGKQ